MQLPRDRWQELPPWWVDDKSRAEDAMDWRENYDAELRRIDRQAKWLAVAAVISGVTLVIAASWVAWWMI